MYNMDSVSPAFTPPGEKAGFARFHPGRLSEKREQVERREYRRYEFTAEAKVIDVQSGATVSARCSDTSMGGCFIDARSPLPVGSSVRVTLTRDDNMFSADAIVATSMDAMGMGLKFPAVDPDQRRILKLWIKELGGEPEELLTPVLVPRISSGSSSPERANSELPYILNELILVLLRKGILSEEQGKDMLRRLLA
jgi:hypothetical protein